GDHADRPGPARLALADAVGSGPRLGAGPGGLLHGVCLCAALLADRAYRPHPRLDGDLPAAALRPALRGAVPERAGLAEYAIRAGAGGCGHPAGQRPAALARPRRADPRRPPARIVARQGRSLPNDAEPSPAGEG